ncbi:MAG: hypothetical protein ACOCRO_09685 [Halanaerobiales bacterium]
MGTIKEQRPRIENLTKAKLLSQGETLKEIAKKLDITFSEAVDLFLAVAKVNDYDAKDEQIAGLAEIIEDFMDIFKEMAEEY